MAILAFHSINKKFSPGITNYSPLRFKKLLQRLIDINIKFVSLEQYLNSEDKNGLVSLTFDDGYDSFYFEVLPILNRHNIPATIFIPAAYVGKPANWDYLRFFGGNNHLNKEQLKECVKYNIEIGSHGLSHTDLTLVSGRLLERELRKSKVILEDITGLPVKYISYPFGRYNEMTENACAEAGYHRGFALSYFRKSRYAFSSPRYAVYSIDTFYSVLQKIGLGNLTFLEKLKGSIINSFSAGTILLNRFRAENPLSGD
jgi:peptidoglycan/xylan/chitin deacetylase (PgdA/CDA1 family)